ncbi:AMP-binding enzyme domain-containing protein [Trichoderma breve]|uniref:AMP-binding enzyme domain-containing protein n=1 Tax=Trichoderma breve TaxID=2034170 RepID=A0A9W9JPZ7_9HYPO|nr:AMP-binding enzyme domain-containing protein [Trichoderma breve]KAJ4863654.1 AMP-binding enzyme domain-containing protein [Trichoderma breve]
MASTNFDKLPRKLWEHPDRESTRMWQFMQDVNKRYNLNLQSFTQLYKWSCAHRSDFYRQLWEFIPYIHEGTYTRVVDESIPITGVPRWFEGVRLNWAENALYSRDTSSSSTEALCKLNKEDDKIAFTEVREGNTDIRHVTWGELRQDVAALAAALKERGLQKGDRVVIVGGHSYRTYVVFMATVWLGGIFSSSSTDMGVGGLLQRAVQVNPKFVFFDDGTLYNGKTIDLRPNIRGMMEGMSECDNLQSFIIIQRFAKPFDTSSIPKTERFESFLQAGANKSRPAAVRVEFMDPSIIVYSSGTTGTPKALVHAVGTVFISSSRDVLHRNYGPTDVGLQYTTTGWIMYLSSVAITIYGARCVAYDGSPLVPDPKMFEWFYDTAFPKRAQLANISGGTDIAGCFGQENPLDPVYVGGCQGPVLGIPIAAYDHDLPEGSPGTPLPHGTPGDLVATAAFPNMPVFLWNDGPGPAPGPKYRAAYFERFAGAWAQGDFCAMNPHTGAVLMLGRSDGVLNPSGIRFGSADIYAVLERCFPIEIADSLCVGQRRQQDLDERVVLFVLMKPGLTLDLKLVRRIKDAIAEGLTKRHVPKYVFEIPEIPTTVNGKKVETPVKSIISGRAIKPSGTLLNPQCLQHFYQYQKIEELVEPRAKL